MTINQTSHRPKRYTHTFVDDNANPRAVASLVLGILSIILSVFMFLGFPLAVIGLVVGVVSLLEIKRTSQRGQGFAIIGIFCCTLAILYPIILVFLTYPMFTNFN